MRIVLSSSGSGSPLGFRTNEVADVSVIEASDHVWSCPCTHGCVLTTSNVVQERRSANCRVETGAASSRVIILERHITNGGILSASDISKSAESPMALLLNPSWLLIDAETPKAPLKSPSGLPRRPLRKSAATPTAVFRVPVALNNIAAAPTAVFAQRG